MAAPSSTYAKARGTINSGRGKLGRLVKLSKHFLSPAPLKFPSRSAFIPLIVSARKSPQRFRLAICCCSSSSYSSSPSKTQFDSSIFRPYCCAISNPSAEAIMTVTAAPYIHDGGLTVNGRIVSTGLPSNVAVSPVTSGSAFLGASAARPSSRHVFSLGVLQGSRFLALYRAKVWWMIPRFGKLGSEVPMETQLLLLEAREDSALCDEDSTEPVTGKTSYILLLPVLDGEFRASLQGSPSNELQFCVESGDDCVQTSQVAEAVFVNSGDNPYELLSNSIKILEKHKGTFHHIENKKQPAHLNWFGWCTWDAFYKDVNPKGIIDGLQSFREGGCPPRFLIIDDGWQDTTNEYRKEGEPHVDGTEFASRLFDIKESSKFRGSDSSTEFSDFSGFVKSIKENNGLKFVYVWHALAGYWGGLDPSSEFLKKYKPKIAYPIQSPGNIGNIRDIAIDSLEKYGIGIIEPQNISQFYEDLHSYLASCGIDGVKADVQNVIETLGSGYGGRVSLTRQYLEALEESIVRNFKANNLISCMCHNTEALFSSKTTATARASDDFVPKEPTMQTIHIAAVAFTSLLLGEIVVPDWDMFQSKHSSAEFHGAARALGGCAVYVSDQPDMHDFNILKKLVLPDGSVLRARYAGRPTRDCLFVDPVMDGKSLLKIWNLNKLSGVVGVFNCQGAGNWPLTQLSEPKSISLSGHVSPLDVEFLEQVACENWSGDCAVYAFKSGSLSRLPKYGKIKVCLETLNCEIYTISPITVFNHRVHFAPLGLIHMYNSGGATEAVNCSTDASGCKVVVKARGCGRFGAYSSIKPSHCSVDAKEAEFMYNADSGLLALELEGECNMRAIEIIY